MLIDWVTARVPLNALSDEARAVVQAIGDRVMRYCPSSGNVRWETCAWDAIRSDTHQVVVKVGSDFWMQGSPARVIGDGCSVFGAGAAGALDISGCVERMAAFVSGVIGAELPSAKDWLVTRIDVTGNLLLDSLQDVRAALRVLRECEGGRYRVSQQAGDTVYWAHRSKLRAGKAYAKGPHLRYLAKQATYTGREYSAAELTEAERLLRLELKLGREYFARTDWRAVGRHELTREWQEYFGRMIGASELTMDTDIRERIEAVAPSEGRAKAAYGCWAVIQAEGWERARGMFARTTWYRHLQVLRAAGLGDADIAAERVVPLRRRVFDSRIVTDWSELRAA